MSKVRGGQVFVEIGADPRKLFKALGDLNKSIGKIGASMANLGTRMTAVGAAIAAPVGLAMRQFAQFDDAIRATAAVSQASGAELQKLNDKARELGATTSFTAVQVANLMTELGRAGFKPDEINAMTGAVLDLARATGTDAALSAGIMAATLRQFGLGATEAARAADVLTKAANSTFNTVEGLGESLKYAGPVAKSLGLSLEDTTAILGVLGNVGIQGSEAGTALRRLSVISAASGEELQKLFGITNVDASGNLKPLVDILDEINTATANMPVAERTAKMAQAFGLLGITSANVLSSSADGVRGLADSLRDAEGTASKAAKEMDAGLGGALRIALSAVEGTALAIGDALAPSVQKLLNGVEAVATGLTKFVKENEALVITAAKGIGIFTGVGVSLLFVGKAIAIVSGAIAFVMSPLGLIVGALGGLGAAVLVANGSLGDMAGIATTTFKGIYDAITDGDLSGAMDILWAGLKAGWLKGIESIVVAWYKGVGEIKKAFVQIGSAWDKYVTKPTAVFGIRVAEAAQERDVLGAFDTTQGTVFDNESKKAARARRKAAEDLLASSSAESFAANKAVADRNIADLQKVVNAASSADASAEERKAGEAAAKEIAAYREAVSLVKGRFAQLGIKTEEERAAAVKKAQDEIDAATQKSVDDERSRSGASGAADDLTQRARGKTENRARNDQFTRLLKDVEGATTLDALRGMYDEFDALSSNGRLTSAQMTTLETALEDAQERVSKATSSMGGQSPAAKIRSGAGAAAGDAAQSQAEVAGTFSSMALGGLGFGSSLAQKQLDTLKAIENNTRPGDDGLVAA